MRLLEGKRRSQAGAGEIAAKNQLEQYPFPLVGAKRRGQNGLNQVS